MIVLQIRNNMYSMEQVQKLGLSIGMKLAAIPKNNPNSIMYKYPGSEALIMGLSSFLKTTTDMRRIATHPRPIRGTTPRNISEVGVM